MPNLLIEIGTEELPLAGLDVIYGELADKVKKTFADSRIAFKSVTVEATPRRIALFVDGLAERQQDQVTEISGPSYDKAYDAEGKPTRALEGFLKSKNAALKDVQIKETPKGKFIVLQKKDTGKSVVSILPIHLHAIFTSLSFPKQMRWEATGFRFPRPIRWIVALVDRNRLPFELAGVKSGTQSRGHRFLANKVFPVRKAKWSHYTRLLKEHHVILGLKQREELIRQALARRFDQRHADEELVHINAQLVEEPFLIRGHFSKTYLDLPAEVLASCMKKNQKIFACYDGKGRLVPHFVAVMNGKRKGLARICQDYENVLESRLRDARFFYDADLKEPLEKKRSMLEQLVYLGKLGSMLQKTERLEKLAGAFAMLIGRADLKADLERAARLSKVDLITHLVYEFPDLQGIAGREYALEGGEKESVAAAIGMQYLPKNLAEDFRDVKKQMPPFAAMLGIVDRLDLLVGAFGIGMEPSSSQDPFALRRAGGVLVKLIRAFGFHFSMTEAVGAAISLYGPVLEISPEDLKKRLILNFFKDRVARELQLESGSRFSEIFQAVWQASARDINGMDLADIYVRFTALCNFYDNDTDSFMKAAKVVERTSNILRGSKEEIPVTVDPALFKDPAEEKLWQILESKSSEITSALERRDYEKATFAFGHVFYAAVHEYFKQVMINVEDGAIRRNRLALMKRLFNLYGERLADLSILSKIEIE